MTRLLDARTSQNINSQNSVSIALPTATPTMIGVIGLNMFEATESVRVQLFGTATVNARSISEGATLTLSIIRGNQPSGPIVSQKSVAIAASEEYSDYPMDLIASDYNPPTTDQLVYTLVLQMNGNVQNAFRIGPESFNGAAYSN
ncbi:hypothetical protein [Gorillibacterium sp. sgz500922]|uniref:hypothetical protein n=1 Tax=Gorillibacterium sp. sgz500922 TaxID=3446694 RepID=UPI003F681EE3